MTTTASCHPPTSYAPCPTAVTPIAQQSLALWQELSCVPVLRSAGAFPDASFVGLDAVVLDSLRLLQRSRHPHWPRESKVEVLQQRTVRSPSRHRHLAAGVGGPPGKHPPPTPVTDSPWRLLGQAHARPPPLAAMGRGDASLAKRARDAAHPGSHPREGPSPPFGGERRKEARDGREPDPASTALSHCCREPGRHSQGQLGRQPGRCRNIRAVAAADVVRQRR